MGEPFPGPYSWKYHPWVKDMMDSAAPFNYSMKGAQLGVTEVAINRAFYVLDQLKRDVLYVLPTTLNAQDFSNARFAAALTLSPYIRSMFTNVNSVRHKQAGHCNLYIRGSRGDSNLKSIPVAELILDEVDEMDLKAVHLALERLSGQREETIKVWGISTPKIPEKGIHSLYMTGTQEHFVFKCPLCSRLTELTWPDSFEICGDTDNDPRVSESHLKCLECKGKLKHEEKPLWLANAYWKPTYANATPGVRSFHITQLYSYTVSPAKIAIAYHQSAGSEAATNEFYNSKIGVPYISEGARVSDEMIEACIGNHTRDSVDRPTYGGEKLTMLGVDQGKWNYWSVIEGVQDRKGGDISTSHFAKVVAFGKFLEDDWHILDELMQEWQIMYAVIDADPNIIEARRFVREYPKFAAMSRYRRGQTGKELSISDEESGAPIITVDRTNWISATLGRFKEKRISLPRDVSIEYREHMKALVRTYVKDPNGNYVGTYIDVAPDHYAHSLVYAEIAMHMAAGGATSSDVEKFL